MFSFKFTRLRQKCHQNVTSRDVSEVWLSATLILSIRFDFDRSILALRDDQLNAIIEEGKMLLRRTDPVDVAIEGEVIWNGFCQLGNGAAMSGKK
jgi:hypothetical protein